MEVRDNASISLASFMFIFKEQISVYLDKIEKVKKQKVLEQVENIKNNSGNIKCDKVVEKSTVKPSIVKQTVSKPLGTQKSNLKPAVSAPKSKSKTKPVESKSANLEVKEVEVKYEFSLESATDYFESRFSSEFVAEFSNSSWKIRLESNHNFNLAITCALDKIKESKDLSAEATIRYLLKFPGWKESNFQVSFS